MGGPEGDLLSSNGCDTKKNRGITHQSMVHMVGEKYFEIMIKDFWMVVHLFQGGAAHVMDESLYCPVDHAGHVGSWELIIPRLINRLPLR